MEEDKVIDHIRGLFKIGKLEPGDRLPAERRLAEQLGVSRSHVRSAYQKLEFYGIAKTYPQSGTVLAQHSVQALTSQFAGLMQVQEFDFASLLHVRNLLEVEAIKLAIKHATDEDIENIKEALGKTIDLSATESRNEQDFQYHHSIARASHNPVISSLLLVITPDTLDYYRRHQLCSVPNEQVNNEHIALFEAIAAKDEKKALRVLKDHFKGITEFAKSLKK